MAIFLDVLNVRLEFSNRFFDSINENTGLAGATNVWDDVGHLFRWTGVT
jgi:hypothetical protein